MSGTSFYNSLGRELRGKNSASKTSWRKGRPERYKVDDRTRCDRFLHMGNEAARIFAVFCLLNLKEAIVPSVHVENVTAGTDSGSWEKTYEFSWTCVDFREGHPRNY